MPKLWVSYLVRLRINECANAFVADTADRFTNRVQLTSDGLRACREAVDAAFGGNGGFAQLIKSYGNTPEGEKRYSPQFAPGGKSRSKPIVLNPSISALATSKGKISL